MCHCEEQSDEAILNYVDKTILRLFFNELE